MDSVLSEDTIVAIATPPGRGAIAVIRVSGKDAHLIAQTCIPQWPAFARRATLCDLYDRNGAVVDYALVTVFDAPKSFTGENMVEIATHGGFVVPVLVVSALVGAGARQALPGEFTRRAVLNGKIDLVQAEAIGDLIDAKSRAMHGAALRQLDGGLSRRILQLREQIIDVEALIAYDIDFPEEDDGPISRDRITNAVAKVRVALDELLATAPAGELVREGAVAVIAGPPNVGKSSLFNAFLGSDRAIVTDVPGTTRDAIEAVIDTDSWPIRLVDTAGLRETNDTVERIGIEISTRYLKDADVILACGDDETTIEATVLEANRLSQAPILRVRTKGDVGNFETKPNVYIVSAKTGVGLKELIGGMNRVITEQYGALSLDAPVLTRERHRYSIEKARTEIREFESQWDMGVLPAPVIAVHLRAAGHELEEIVGAIDVEDIFDRLFQTFCVGK